MIRLLCSGLLALVLSGFFVVPAVHAQSVDGLTLINADTDQPIRALSSTDTVEVYALSTSNLSIRADVSGSPASVQFDFAGISNYQTENVAPYALNGDSNGNFDPVPELSVAGSYALTATPYTGSDASGTAGTPLSVDVTVLVEAPAPDPGCVDGEGNIEFSGPRNANNQLMALHPITITIDGPCASESGTPNPFLDYRLQFNITSYTDGSIFYQIPAFFAADGDAANTGATSGNVWKAYFTPPIDGAWSVTTSFWSGPGVAVADDPGATDPAYSAIGTALSLAPSSACDGVANCRDHRGKGILQYTGGRYLQFADSTYFLKGGADSPENLFAYSDFDGTSNAGGTNYVRDYTPHKGDWNAGDPTWQGTKGKGLIGALNYLASEGMNAFSFLTMNVNGDGKDVWPWTSPSATLRYDVSKLAQWNVVMTHADSLGMFMHFKTQETENDQYLDGGDLGTERKLYYRELIARFAHHHALNWNLGEEYDVYAEKNDGDQSRLKSYADYIRAVDPYDHPIVVHTYPGQKNAVYTDLLGFANFEGPSLQLSGMNATDANSTVAKWVADSEAAGRPWNVSIDEPGTAQSGLQPDASDNYDAAREVLWGAFLAGADGLEWYFGYSYPDDDLDADDWRSRDRFWDYHRIALDFMRTIPFPTMTAANARLSGESGFVFATPAADTLAVYLRDGGTGAAVTLPSGTFDVQWLDVRNGGALQTGPVAQVTGGTSVPIGAPPSDTAQDWVALVTQTSGGSTPSPSTVAINAGGPAYTGSDGTAWSADAFFTSSNTYGTSQSIAGTTDDPLYETERYGTTFSYRIPVTNGTYTVDLHFAEIYWSNPGQRVFSVDVENGQGTLSNYDIVADVGASTAVVKTFAGVSVTDGTLDVDFTTQTNNAKVSALRVSPTNPSAALTSPSVTREEAPQAFAVHGNAPNPFRGATTLSFDLPESQPVRLTVYDVLGRTVATLVDAELGPGRHTVRWAPREASSGLYLYRLQAGPHAATGRMTRIR